MKVQTCYMCPQPATTREHVPPRSFFISPYNKGLKWVPSCERHNNGNSLDVEYVRTIIPTALQTNEVAREIGASKVLRTFERSPRLYERIFKNHVPIMLGNEETIAYGVEFDRLRRILEAIAYGIHYLHFGRKYAGKWWFYSPALVSLKAIRAGKGDGQDEIRQAFSKLPIAEVETPHPEVFQFGIHAETVNQIMFRFIFYGGFEIYARGTPSYKKFKKPKGAF